jgi:hypothetical protein
MERKPNRVIQCCKVLSDNSQHHGALIFGQEEEGGRRHLYNGILRIAGYSNDVGSCIMAYYVYNGGYAHITPESPLLCLYFQ